MYDSDSGAMAAGSSRCCVTGLVYPHASTTLSCYVKGQARVAMAELLGAEPYQRDHKALMLRFDVVDLDEVVAILKPKRLRGSAVLTAEQRRNVSRHAFAATRHSKSRRSRSRSTLGDALLLDRVRPSRIADKACE